MSQVAPLPPPNLLMQIANDPSQENFQASFLGLRAIVLSYIERAGRSLEDMERILDFGCGPGRLLYALQPLMAPHQELHGCDVNADCARWAGENLHFANVIQNEMEPPLPFPDNHFDMVYAASVFTHMSLNLQFKWAWEIQRVLKPGGIALLTTSSAIFFIRAFNALDVFSRKEMFVFNDDDILAVLTTGGGDEIEGQREVAVIHNLGAARSVFSAFEMIEQIPVSMLCAGQSLNLLRAGQAKVEVLSSEAMKGVFRSAESRSDALELDIPRKGRLRFAVEFEHEHFAGRTLSWEIGDTTAPFRINSIFGRNHLIEFDLPVLSAGRQVLRLVANQPGVFQTDVAFSLRFLRVEH